MKPEAGKDACAPRLRSGGLMVGRRSYKPDVRVQFSPRLLAPVRFAGVAQWEERLSRKQ